MFWTVNLKGGPRRVEHAAVTLDDRIYFFGGYCEAEVNFISPIVVQILNTKTYQWTPVLPSNPKTEDNCRTPDLLRGHSAVVFGDKVFIWGGRNLERDTNELLRFDTVEMQWSRPTVSGRVPEPRFGHTACVIDNCMYIFGGQSQIPAMYLDEVFCLDLLKLNWKLLHTHGYPPPSLSFSTAVPVGKRMYIYGGEDVCSAETYFTDVMYLDTSSRRWHKLVAHGTIPRARGKHSVFMYNNYLCVFGGYNSQSGEHFNDLHRFNLDKAEWEAVNPLGQVPKPRHRHSSLRVGEKVFVFGGTSCYPFSSTPTGAAAMVLYHHNDLHVLDLSPSLRTLCLRVVLQCKLDASALPENLQKELSLISPNKVFVVHV